ncbi:hypothetical protein HMPREF1421_00059 [Helicobacter pylori GAM265BSii]|uniref:Uncharacterized protein n=1 Tax=Helicobacter pylori GAM265BSii TaxID=1159049 RepID=M3Q1B6_HELPX|nr:hypothetical protein HMPREF1421_00059 [Helicobacter pylori GAM265BSii]
MRTEPFFFKEQGMFRSPYYTQPLWQNFYFLGKTWEKLKP